jgi:hypothetical protein
LQPVQRSAGSIQRGKVHQAEIAPILLVAADAFVVVEQVAAAVQDQPAAVDLDRSQVV